MGCHIDLINIPSSIGTPAPISKCQSVIHPFSFTVRYQFANDNLDGLITAPKLPEPDCTLECNHCKRKLQPNAPFLQWEFLAFCSAYCYEMCMYSGNYECAMCAKDCNSHYVIYAQIIGDQLNHFCSKDCENDFFELMKFCRFCRSLIAINAGDFCGLDCRNKFNQINIGTKENTVKRTCHQCRSQTIANISLTIDEIVHHYCSFACFFYEKMFCGIVSGTFKEQKKLDKPPVACFFSLSC